MISVDEFAKLTTDKFLRAAIKRTKISIGGNYGDFIEQLYSDINDLIYHMQSGRELWQKDGKDPPQRRHYLRFA